MPSGPRGGSGTGNLWKFSPGGDPGDIFGLSEEYLAEGELEDGGVHGLYIILGAMGREVSATVLSYEGVVGVGSPLIRFDPKRSGPMDVTALHTLRENFRAAEC
jgi:hypothetical protein